MRKLLQFSIAALLALGLVLAASSASADIKVYGIADAAFGQYTPEDGDGVLTNHYDFRLQTLWTSDGPISAHIDLRSRGQRAGAGSGGTGPLEYYKTINWAVSDAVTLTITDNLLVATLEMSHRNGYVGMPSHDGGSHGVLVVAEQFRIDYNGGAFHAGLAILPGSCHPGCVSDAGAASDTASQTMVPYAYGAFGDFAFRFAYEIASGEDSATGDSASGTGMMLTGKYNLGDMALFFHYTSNTQGAGDAVNSTGLAFEGFNVFFSYASTADVSTDLVVQYTMPQGKGQSAIVGYNSHADDTDSGGGDTEIYLALRQVL